MAYLAGDCRGGGILPIDIGNRYVHPRTGVLGGALEHVANSRAIARVRRAIMGRLPFPVLVSDVVDVVYATWLVDADRVSGLLPPQARLWKCQGRTPFTILTYRHGCFGPRWAGRMRRWFPSPLQSNWRLYLDQPIPGGPPLRTVVFVKNVLNHPLYALGTRVFSDALPSHLAAGMSLHVASREISVVIDGGIGSAPTLSMRLERCGGRILPDGFAGFGEDWTAAVARLSAQEAAAVPVADAGRTALATISLPVDTDALEPLTLRRETLRCPWLDALEPSAEALCFRLPQVRFEALSERLL